MPWQTNGRITNPAASQVLADTGPVAEVQGMSPQVIASSTVGVGVILEHRDAANAATLKSHIFPLSANSSFEMNWDGYFDVQAGERLRLVTSAAATGSVQGSLVY